MKKAVPEGIRFVYISTELNITNLMINSCHIEPVEMRQEFILSEQPVYIQLQCLLFSKVLMEIRDGFDAFEIIGYIIFLIWGVDIVIIQAKAQ